MWDLHVLALKQADAYSQSGPQDDDLRDIPHAYLETGGEFVVAVADDADEIIGMGGARRAAPDTAEITRMRVLPRFQRHGIGEAIYDYLENRARELGYRKLTLDTTVGQHAARALYRKKGFRETGRITMGGFECISLEKTIG